MDQRPVFLYPLTFDFTEEEKHYIKYNAPDVNYGRVDQGWVGKWMAIFNKGLEYDPQWTITKNQLKKVKQTGRNGYNQNQLNKIKEEVDLYLDGPRGETKSRNIAPTRGMKYNDNSCWFDALAFVILADPTQQILECLEHARDGLRNYLHVVRNFMYGEGNDPETSIFIRNKYEINEQGYADTLPNELDVCGIEWNEFPNRVDPHTKILFVHSNNPVTDGFTRYGHVFLRQERRRDRTINHFTSGIYVDGGKFLYYDDNDSTIENRLRLLDRVPHITTGGNNFDERWDVYYRFVDGGETKRQVPAVSVDETKGERKVRDHVGDTKTSTHKQSRSESQVQDEYYSVIITAKTIVETSEDDDDVTTNLIDFMDKNVRRDILTRDHVVSHLLQFDPDGMIFKTIYEHVVRIILEFRDTSSTEFSIDEIAFICEQNVSRYFVALKSERHNYLLRRAKMNNGTEGYYLHGDTFISVDKLKQKDHITVYDAYANVIDQGPGETIPEAPEDCYAVFPTHETFERVKYILQQDIDQLIPLIKYAFNGQIQQSYGSKTDRERNMWEDDEIKQWLADKLDVFIDNGRRKYEQEITQWPVEIMYRLQNVLGYESSRVIRGFADELHTIIKRGHANNELNRNIERLRQKGKL